MRTITKVLVIAIATIFFTNNTQASNLIYSTEKSVYNDEEAFTLLRNDQMMFRANDVHSRSAIQSVTHNGLTNMVKITTEETIASLEILNEQGELEFILPIGAKILNLDLLDFAKGTYSINLVLQSKEKVLVKSTMVKSF